MELFDDADGNAAEPRRTNALRIQDQAVTTTAGSTEPVPDYHAPVLVTGGAGYIGVPTVRRLLDTGRQVRVLDAMLYTDRWLDPVRSHPALEIVPGDIRDRETVARALTGVQRVAHLAAIVGDPACALDERLTISTNVEATELLVREAADAGVRRLVFASTCSVYGAGDGQLLTEESPLNPVSLYASSKIAAEEMIRGAGPTGVEPVILRFSSIYGLAPRPRFDLVVNLLVGRAISGLPVTIYGGEQERPFLTVEDCARAVELALRAPSEAVAGWTFNVGDSAENYRLRAVGELIAAAVPGTALEIQADAADRRTYAVDFSRFAAAVGFSASLPLRQGIVQLAGRLRRMTDLDITSPLYANAAALQLRLRE